MYKWTNVHDNRIFYVVLTACCTIQLLLIYHTDGTGGFGDSIAHFLIARAAPHNPVLYLDHWGKPLFTLLASPFASMGFTSVQLFNILMTATACTFTYYTAKVYNLRFAPLVPLFYFFSAEVLEVTPYSFTEPVFACVFASGTYLLVANRLNWGVVVLSFLPFARSEGLIILCVVAVYLFVIKAYKNIPLLFTGHIVYAIAGMFIYHDILWVFTRIPYATIESVYGKGEWYHFFFQMYYISGPVTCALAIGGVLSLAIRWVHNRFTFRHAELTKPLFLTAGMLLAFLTAHSMFWALGIFGSLGLTRVVVGMAPSVSLLAVVGLGAIVSFNPGKVIYYFVLLVSVGGECIETFMYSPTAVNKTEFILNEGQRHIAYDVAPYVREKYADYTVYLSDLALSYYIDKNLYDTSARQVYQTKPSFHLKEKEVIVWDTIWTGTLHSISFDTLLSKPYLKLDTCFIRLLQNGTTSKIGVFVMNRDSISISHK